MSGPRVGLIGARRVRQGLGPFVARDLLAADAAIPCLLGTRPETVESARRDLRATLGIDARGYTDLESMLARERLEALAILCPPEAHERYLAAALHARLHALCEKPLLWGGDALGRRARDIVQRFAEAGLLLRENCQWPYALPALRALHPAAFEGPPRLFFMRLSPVSSGAALLGDCLPHPLSVLQALMPDPNAGVRDVRFRELATQDKAPALANLCVEFDYCSDSGRVGVELELRYGPSPPRVAAIGLNGYHAQRRVEEKSYRLELVWGDRKVELPDPLTALVRDFVGDVRAVGAGAGVPGDGSIGQRMSLLEEITDAFEEWSALRARPPLG